MQRFRELLAEQDRFRRLANVQLAHPLGPLVVHVGLEIRPGEVRLEPVVPAVDEVTARRGVGGIGGRGGGLRITRADEQTQVLIVRLKARHPIGLLPWRKLAFVLVGVHREREAELLEVVGTGDAAGHLLGVRKAREQHRRKDGNDGDHHEQFNKAERRALARTQRSGREG